MPKSESNYKRPQYNAMYCECMNTDLPLRASYMPPWLLSPLPSQHQHGQHLDQLIFRLIIIYHSFILIFIVPQVKLFTTLIYL